MLGLTSEFTHSLGGHNGKIRVGKSLEVVEGRLIYSYVEYVKGSDKTEYDKLYSLPVNAEHNSIELGDFTETIQCDSSQTPSLSTVSPTFTAWNWIYRRLEVEDMDEFEMGLNGC